MTSWDRKEPYISLESDGTVRITDLKGETSYTHEEAKKAIARYVSVDKVKYFLCSSSIDFPEEYGHPANIRELIGLQVNVFLSNLSYLDESHRTKNESTTDKH